MSSAGEQDAAAGTAVAASGPGAGILDAPKAVRAGEELDTGALARWFAQALPALPAFHGALEVQQFPKGHSNLTYLVRPAARQPTADSPQPELVLRRPPFGSKVKTAHDMGREFRILAPLSRVWPLAPRPLAHCDDLSVIGVPFYAMERLHGRILRGGSAGQDLTVAQVRALGEAFVDTLAELHALDYRAAGLGALGHPEGYIERQVTGWTTRYQNAKTDDIPEVEEIARWLAAHRPAESGAVLIHNDFKFDNLVLDAQDPTRIIGVLDWEMSTIGDPLMDLATALAYWVEAGDRAELKAFAFGPTFLPGSLTRREIVARYAQKSGRDASGILFHFCFAQFKNAVVAQQIYERYQAGLTKDERFAKMIFGVKILSQEALLALERGTI